MEKNLDITTPLYNTQLFLSHKADLLFNNPSIGCLPLFFYGTVAGTLLSVLTVFILVKTVGSLIKIELELIIYLIIVIAIYIFSIGRVDRFYQKRNKLDDKDKMILKSKGNQGFSLSFPPKSKIQFDRIYCKVKEKVQYYTSDASDQGLSSLQKTKRYTIYNFENPNLDANGSGRLEYHFDFPDDVYLFPTSTLLSQEKGYRHYIVWELDFHYKDEKGIWKKHVEEIEVSQHEQEKP